MKRKTKIN